MPPKIAPTVQVQAPRIQLVPKIIWIWTNLHERTCLWPRPMLIDDEHERPGWSPQVSEEFFDALNCAQERLWIMDPYFDGKVGLASLWLSLQHTNLSEIRVIGHDPIPQSWIDERRRREPISVNIEWRQGFPELHDRFAIIDDEAWHFGSTVGGGYFRFGAATRGWDADELATLFKNKWESL